MCLCFRDDKHQRHHRLHFLIIKPTRKQLIYAHVAHNCCGLLLSIAAFKNCQMSNYTHNLFAWGSTIPNEQRASLRCRLQPWFLLCLSEVGFIFIPFFCLLLLSFSRGQRKQILEVCWHLPALRCPLNWCDGDDWKVSSCQTWREGGSRADGEITRSSLGSLQDVDVLKVYRP